MCGKIFLEKNMGNYRITAHKSKFEDVYVLEYQENDNSEWIFCNKTQHFSVADDWAQLLDIELPEMY
jgi:hypothetical protein